MNLSEIKDDLLTLHSGSSDVIACKLLILNVINKIMRCKLDGAPVDLDFIKALQGIYKGLPIDNICDEVQFSFLKGNLAHLLTQYEVIYKMQFSENTQTAMA
jgi:hypothetical protein